MFLIVVVVAATAAVAVAVLADTDETSVSFELARFDHTGVPISANAAALRAACHQLACDDSWLDAHPGELRRELPRCNVDDIAFSGALAADNAEIDVPSTGDLPATAVCATGEDSSAIVEGDNARFAWKRGPEQKLVLKFTDPVQAACVGVNSVDVGERLVASAYGADGTLLATRTLDQLPAADDDVAPQSDVQLLQLVADSAGPAMARIELSTSAPPDADAGGDAAPGLCVVSTSSACACATDERQCCGVRPEANPQPNQCTTPGTQRIEAEQLDGAIQTNQGMVCGAGTQSFAVVPDEVTFDVLEDATAQASGGKYIQAVVFINGVAQHQGCVGMAGGTTGPPFPDPFEDEFSGPAIAYPFSVLISGTYTVVVHQRCTDVSASTDSLYVQIRDADGKQVSDVRISDVPDSDDTHKGPTHVPCADFEDARVIPVTPYTFELDRCETYYAVIAVRERNAMVDYIEIRPVE